MLEGHYNPTTFNLAFFMHNLFREEIERETQELQAEKNIKVTPQAAPAPAAAAPAVPPPAAPRFGLREEGPARETTFAGAAAASAGSNKGMIIGIAAGLALVLGGGLYWLLNRGGAASAPPQQTAAPAQPAGLTPEELQAQIDKLVREKLAELNQAATTSATQATQDAAKKEEQIKALQKQLEDTRRAQAERPAPAPSRPAPAPVEPPAASTPTTPSSLATATPPAPAPSSPATQPATPPATTTTMPAAPVPAAPAPQPPAPAPVEPTVRRGDLVTPGPGVARPQFVSMPNPRYPEIAKRTNRSATVVVPILVDENGNVTQTKPPAQKAGFGFDDAALDAARRASFRPATKNGVPVKMWMELSVVFKQ